MKNLECVERCDVALASPCLNMYSYSHF